MVDVTCVDLFEKLSPTDRGVREAYKGREMG
jgi:hypothetical protein